MRVRPPQRNDRHPSKRNFGRNKPRPRATRGGRRGTEGGGLGGEGMLGLHGEVRAYGGALRQARGGRLDIYFVLSVRKAADKELQGVRARALVGAELPRSTANARCNVPASSLSMAAPDPGMRDP